MLYSIRTFVSRFGFQSFFDDPVMLSLPWKNNKLPSTEDLGYSIMSWRKIRSGGGGRGSTIMKHICRKILIKNFCGALLDF
jgi:hypothetical protein